MFPSEGNVNVPRLLVTVLPMNPLKKTWSGGVMTSGSFSPSQRRPYWMVRPRLGCHLSWRKRAMLFCGRLLPDDAQDLFRTVRFESIRSPFCQELVKQHTEAVNIRSSSDRTAVKLFGTRIIRGEGRQIGHGMAGIRVEQLCNAEIKQLWRTIGSDQYIRRFQVTVNDKAAMRVRDGIADFLEEPQSLV